MAMTVSYSGYGGTNSSFPFGQHPVSYPYGSPEESYPPQGGQDTLTSRIHMTGTQGQGEEPMMDPRDEDPPISPPPQRERFSYTRYQLELLSAIFCKVRYPSSIQKQLIAKRVGITRDQVKIWFQNRRRKDVVAKQNGEEPPRDITEKGPQMVPNSVVSGVISELIKFENDPKGKKLKARASVKDRRMKPYNSPRPVHGQRYTTPPSYSPQGYTSFEYPQPGGVNMNASSAFNISSPNSINSGPSTSPQINTNMAMFDTLSPDSIGSVGQRLSGEFSATSVTSDGSPTGEIPSSEQLDMVAPPNAIAPTMAMGQVQHRDSESPKSCSASTSPENTNSISTSPVSSASSPQMSMSEPGNVMPLSMSSSQGVPYYGSMYGQYSFHGKPSNFSSTEYTHYQRDVVQTGSGASLAMPMGYPAGHYHPFYPASVKTEGMPTYPYPLMSEQSIARPSVPSPYSLDGYASGKPHLLDQSVCPQQPIHLAPFHNPYYEGHDNSTGSYNAKSFPTL